MTLLIFIFDLYSEHSDVYSMSPARTHETGNIQVSPSRTNLRSYLNKFEQFFQVGFKVGS